MHSEIGPIGPISGPRSCILPSTKWWIHTSMFEHGTVVPHSWCSSILIGDKYCDTLYYRNESQSPCHPTLKPKLTRYELPWKQTNFIRLASLPGSVEDNVREPSSSKATRTMGGQDPSKDDTDGSVHSFICCSLGRRQPKRIHAHCRRFDGSSSRFGHCGCESPRALLLATFPTNREKLCSVGPCDLERKGPPTDFYRQWAAALLSGYRPWMGD